MGKIYGNKVRITTVVILFTLFMATSLPVEAHVPGARPPPKFELEPIVINDSGKLIKITIHDVANYHASQVNKKPQICVCMACAFRAAQLGISKIWGDEIPARDDIVIISKLPTPGSRDCFWYVTGTGPGIETKTKGEFKIVLPDGTEVTNMSNKNLKKLSKNNTLNNFVFTICRKSTNECFDAVVKDDVFPADFFELRRKVKFGNATSEERALFKSEWEKVRDAFLTKPDWELFEGIEKPKEDLTSVLILSILLGACAAVAWYTKKW